jgi:CDP-glucose 4,6-dehydratase
MAFQDYFRGKQVFLTGHTGFKGSWLAEWLLGLGAEVHGYALDPKPHECLFDQLCLSSRLVSDTRADLADRKTLNDAIHTARPDVILHLAAQPLVRLSYEIPVETFATNIMGTAHVLDAARSQIDHPCAVVCVTTDKCYENREWLHAYREEDAMGGHDPYSASKGAAELVISSYRRSYFSDDSSPVKVASARAGNVIGGGDWALDRIVPDCVRAVRAGETIPVRNRIATRPWQHVLEPLGGYLWLAASLGIKKEAPAPLDAAFNFGPDLTSNHSVANLVDELTRHLGGKWRDLSDESALHEASKLNLATGKAYHLLDWRPAWGFEESVAQTARWYLDEAKGLKVGDMTRSQISDYQSAAAELKLSWAL